MTRRTDYVIVGEHGNPQYAFKTFGTKIAKAQDYYSESKGGSRRPVIVREERWRQSVAR